MSEPFVGEIRMFGGNFAPRGWSLCDGQLLAISQNDALFSLFGTTYGGDGRTTFGLPDLRGRVPIHAGQGPGLSSRRLGEKSGAESVTLSSAQVAAHSHPLQATAAAANSRQPVSASQPALLAGALIDVYNSDPDPQNFASAAVTPAGGGGESHTNVQPYQCVNFIVALVGIYPSRQ